MMHGFGKKEDEVEVAAVLSTSSELHSSLHCAVFDLCGN